MKKKILALLLAALLLLPATALAAEADTPAVTAVWNGHTYARFDVGMDWSEAKAYCEAMGGHLACITSEEEQALAETLIGAGPRNHYWIGAYRDGGGFSWVTGEPFSYTHWDKGDPNNVGGHEDAVQILRLPSPLASGSQAMHWNDATDGDAAAGPEEFFAHVNGGFLCEWDSVRDFSSVVTTFNGHSYRRFDEGLTWTEAKARCESLGGHLATITSQAEQTFLEGLIQDGTKYHYWLGGTDEQREGTFAWVTGEPFQFTHWDQNEPNDYSGAGGEDYVHMLRVPNYGQPGSAFGRWNDTTVDCGGIQEQRDYFNVKLTGYICEWDSVRTSFGSQVSGWSLPEMEKASQLGLVPDVLVGENLTKPITRAEFAAVAVKTYEALSGTKAIPIVNNPFTDCTDVEVLKAYGIGAVNGTGPSTFSPDRLLNREQAATMLTRVFKRVTLAGWTLETDGQFTLPYTMPARFADDGEISAFAQDSVYFMAANGIITGISGNRFAPKNVTSAQEAQGYANATREQALAIAVRMVENLK